MFLQFFIFQGFIFFNIEIPNNQLFTMARNQNIVRMILLTCFLGPIFEEIAFRLPIKLTNVNLSVSIVFICYFILSFATSTHLYSISVLSLFIILLSLLLGIVIYCIFLTHDNTTILYNINRWIIIITFSILFAIPHISNYEITQTNKFYVLLLTTPKITSGIIFSLARLKYNLVFSILIHITINLIVFISII